MEGLGNVKAIWGGIGVVAVLQIACLVTLSHPAKLPEQQEPEDYSEQLKGIDGKVDALAEKIDQGQGGKGETLKIKCRNTATYQFSGESVCEQVSQFAADERSPAGL